MLNSRRSLLRIAAVSVTLAPMAVAEGQSTVAVSPFVSYVPSATTNPLAGFALTFGGTTGLALRGSGELSISNPNRTADSLGGYRPWGGDADIILFLGGLGGGATVFSRALSPYLFSGIGLTGGDSAGSNIVRNQWSYGAGATIPLGLDADLFAEARWRMSEYVLPTAKDAPDSKSAFRFGLSFHVGGSPAPAPPRRSRPRRYSENYDERDEVVVAAPAPPPTVIVQAPAPPPTVIVQQPAPVIVTQEPRRQTTININLPRGSRERSTHSTRTVYVTPSRARDSSQPARTCTASPAVVANTRRGSGSETSRPRDRTSVATVYECAPSRSRRR